MRKIPHIICIIILFTGCSKEPQQGNVPQSIQFKEFDTAPIPKSPITPVANVTQYGAEVVVQFYVNLDGKASKAKILKSTANDTLDQAAIRAIENTSFTPAMLKGTPVVATIELEILFPASQKKSRTVTAITRDDLNDVYHTQVASALQDLGVKLTDRQKLDFAVNFQSQISESNIEVNALYVEEEISFLKNEIQNFIFHDYIRSFLWNLVYL